MSISDAAARAARQKAVDETKRLLDMDGSDDPASKHYMPQGESWDQFQHRVEEDLASILGDYPGGNQRLEPGSYNMRTFGHQFPPSIQRQRVIRSFIEEHEVVSVGSPYGGHEHYVVRRSVNPMEEASLIRFDDLATFGEGIA